MGIIFIVKCLFTCFSLTCVKNLVESSETSTNTNPGTQGGTSVTTPSAGGTEPETKTGVELSIKATKATDQFDYNKDGQVVTYTAKDDFKFSLIKDGDNNIWKTENDSDYANKVVSAKRHSGILDVTIHLVNGGSKLFVNDYFYNQWKEIDITKVNTKFVNINYPYNTYFYTNRIDNGVRTFEAITGFVFNVVFEYVNREKVEIWKTDDESEYANKIVNEGGNRVIIHIGEGTSASTKVFNKGTDGKWTEDNGAPTLEKGNSEGESSGTDRSSGGTTTANGGTGSDISKSARLASVESDDAGLVSVSSGEAGEEGSTSGGDASLASTDASPEGSVATPANEVSTSGGSSGEGAGADAAENLTAQPAGGDDAGSLRRGSTRSSGSDSHVKGEPADGTSSQNSKSTQNVHEKKQKAKAFFTDLNKVVNELSQEIDGTNDLAELDSKMREAGYKLSVKLSEFLKLL